MTFIQELATQNLERVTSPAALDTEYILESLRQASPMLHHLATAYGLDYDDLHQESFLVAHKIMTDSQKPHTRPYIHAAIRMHVFELLRKHKPATSLDATLSAESDTTLIDLLIAPEKPQRTKRDYWRKRILLNALRRLPESQQSAIHLFYRFDGTPEVLRSLGRTTHTINSHRSRAYGLLRNDKRLTRAITQRWR